MGKARIWEHLEVAVVIKSTIRDPHSNGTVSYFDYHYQYSG